MKEKGYFLTCVARVRKLGINKNLIFQKSLFAANVNGACFKIHSEPSRSEQLANNRPQETPGNVLHSRT